MGFYTLCILFMILVSFIACSRATKNTETHLSASKEKSEHKEGASKNVLHHKSKSSKTTKEDKKAHKDEPVKKAKEEEEEEEEEETKVTEVSKKGGEHKNYEKELAKARAEGRREAEDAAAKLKQQKAEEAAKKAAAKKKKADKKRRFKQRIDDAVAKRLNKMPMCKGSGNSTGNGTGKNRLGGTNVFKGKGNATD